MQQKMFGDPIDPLTMLENRVIMRPHWQYSVKRSGIRRSRMCCNGSKAQVPKLHAVASTWSSCVELPIQRLFMGISAALELTIYGSDILDAYAHSEAPGIPTFLKIDDAYSDWWKKYRPNIPLNRGYILRVLHCLQGNPLSGTQWIICIDHILIKEMGFRTTKHDHCIYCKVVNGEPIYLLRQIDDMLCACKHQKTAEDIANIIGTKLAFDTEKAEGIVPIEFMGIVTDYNGTDLHQTTHYIEMSAESYLRRLFKSHGWDKDIQSVKDFCVNDQDPITNSEVDQDLDLLGVPATAVANAINAMEVHSENLSISALQTVMNVTKIQPSLDQSIPSVVTIPESTKSYPNGSTKPLSPLPTDCIDKMYSEEGFRENTPTHQALERHFGFGYRNLLGKLMYAFISA